ncbi:MAG: tRNA (adenosine(37)-N6)-dimethylallyltransferase MiaA [Verrucomicrobiota bacterium]
MPLGLVSHTINIIAGPTAVGKTALALDWAEANGAEIVNADAMLFYRGMDIGTAKPSRDEMARVPHHLIDIQPVREAYSIKEYVAAARAVVLDIFNRNKAVLVVGGSGFYLRCFYAPVVDGIEPDPQVRATVEQLEAIDGLPGLLKRLDSMNPKGTGKLHRENPRRVARALERCLISGKSLLELEESFAALPGPFDDFEKRSVLLLRPNDDLHPRVMARTTEMLRLGLVDEVRSLRNDGLEENSPAANSIGYRETLAWLDHNDGVREDSHPLDGPLSEEDLSEAIQLSTRRLIAKQRKWFRNQFEPDLVINGDPSLETLPFIAG